MENVTIEENALFNNENVKSDAKIESSFSTKHIKITQATIALLSLLKLSLPVFYCDIIDNQKRF